MPDTNESKGCVEEKPSPEEFVAPQFGARCGICGVEIPDNETTCEECCDEIFFA